MCFGQNHEMSDNSQCQFSGKINLTTKELKIGN